MSFLSPSSFVNSVDGRSGNVKTTVSLSTSEILNADTGEDGIVYVDDSDDGKRYFWNGTASRMEPIVTLTNFTDVGGTSISGTISDAKDRSTHFGQDTVRVITITANYTLVTADLTNFTLILANSATPITIFWPAQSTTASKIGTEVKVMQYGTGAVTIAGASGVNVKSAGSPTSKGQNSFLILYKILNNEIAVHTDIIASGGPVLVTLPTIAGTGITGWTMTLTPGTYSPDGTHTRQWRRINISTGAVTNIGAGGLTYVLVAGDEGNYVDCVETVTDSNNLSVQVASNRITPVAAASKPVNTSRPGVLNGSSSTVGGTLTIHAGAWTNSPTGYKFQRRLNGVNSGSVTNQAGASLAYVIQSGDAGGDITYSVVAYNGSGDADVAATSPGWAIAGAIPVFTVNPQITYSATTAGSVMTCGNGTTNVSTSITKNWGFLDASGPYEGYLIPPQTGGTYTTLTDDIGSQIWCEVTASNAYGSVTVRALGPTITPAVAPPPPPPPPVGNSSGVRSGVVLTNRSTQLTATSGQTISGIRFNGSIANQLLIPQGVTGVLVEDCEFTNSPDVSLYTQGTNVTVRFCYFHDCERGILNEYGSGLMVSYCDFFDIVGSNPFSSAAIENNYSNGITTITNNTIRGQYNGDAVSNYSSSRVTMTNNTWNVTILDPSGAAFTIGDSTNSPPAPIIPGRDFYVAFNAITQSGGVPAGVFGSSGNTIIEYNCFSNGIQLRDYPPPEEGGPAPFIGVTVRHNLINIGNSYVPQVALGNVAEWETNVDGTNCALTPTP